MKHLLCILCFSYYNVFAQKSDVIHIDSIPYQGILLDKGWKWHTGDDPEYAKSDFNDSTWESIDPTKDIFDLPQVSKNGDIFWLRLHLSLDSDVNQQLVMMTLQSGASEVYINGKLDQRFGKLSEDPNMIKAFNPKFKPIPFNLDKNATIVLAIRYAFQPKIKYSTLFQQQNPIFKMELRPAELARQHYYAFNTKMRDSLIFRIGAFLILLISYFSIYLFYPLQKANLSFCIYALFIWLSDLIQLNTYFFNNGVDVFYILNIILDLTLLAPLFLLSGLYALFDQKKTWIYWTLCSLVIIGIFISATSYRYGQLISLIFISNLANIEIVRASIKSIKSGKRGSWIIAIGGISFLISWVLFSLGWGLNFANHYVLGTIYTIGDLTYNLALLSIPIAISIYLGLDIANTNRSLQQKLIEVETLSEEKHILLSTQNETLEKQVTERTTELQQSLATLKETQSQLIQSEKLASLGELTAGIAHEIQNPLNFVNNFSEINIELVDELKSELVTGHLHSANEIAEGIKENSVKINLHGKRAESIVKGMLQHSRKSSGIKELTDINKLCDEFVRLSYHGLRAKEKDFNCDFKSDLDPTLPLMNVVSQDIGRVLLNIINNAFQACNEKSGSLKSASQEDYKPMVTVNTKYVASLSRCEICISDNGSGISDNIKDKIFQPFFTTKPTGQGTGLGLSLAYDIVKAHGGSLSLKSNKYEPGTIDVKSIEGEGTEFIIRLPV